MDAKIVVRYSAEEKADLTNISSDLGLNLSSFIRKKTLGKNLTEEYLGFIRESLNSYEEDDLLTLKEILGIHWNYMSKAEKKHLLKAVVEAIEEEELPLDVFEVKKNGKYKFVKATNISSVFKEFQARLYNSDQEEY